MTIKVDEVAVGHRRKKEKRRRRGEDTHPCAFSGVHLQQPGYYKNHTHISASVSVRALFEIKESHHGENQAESNPSPQTRTDALSFQKRPHKDVDPHKHPYTSTIAHLALLTAVIRHPDSDTTALWGRGGGRVEDEEGGFILGRHPPSGREFWEGQRRLRPPKGEVVGGVNGWRPCLTLLLVQTVDRQRGVTK